MNDGRSLVPEWIDGVRSRPAAWSRPSSADGIDGAARLRAAAAITTGEVVSLGRSVGSAVNASPQSPSMYELTATMRTEGRIVVARDRLTADQHGMVNTHLDALNHFGADGTWHGGAPVNAEDAPSIADLGAEGIVTRAILLDIPSVRGTAWVDADVPVSAEDLDEALAEAHVDMERGDALLLYMGRDRFEAAGYSCDVPFDAAAPRPGVGESGARWIAERDPSALLWDFLEASAPGSPRYAVHLLTWAAGLLLVDNAELGVAQRMLAPRREKTGLLVVAPLRVRGATGSLVNPLLVI